MCKEKRWISSELLFTSIIKEFAEGRQAAFTVTGMSMWPFLCHGRDQVIVGSCRPEEIRREILFCCRPIWEIIFCTG